MIEEFTVSIHDGLRLAYMWQLVLVCWICG